MQSKERIRRLVAAAVLFVVVVSSILINDDMYEVSMPVEPSFSPAPGNSAGQLAADTLLKLEVKGRAPKTNYSRAQFGDGWKSVGGCDMRNIILKRDLDNVVTNSQCQVVSGVLDDPYTGNVIKFSRGELTSSDVQIDHVVALSDAWQKGAQQLTMDERIDFANDPLNLLAVDGVANQEKSDSDAASWLPSNKSFRCQYVARQVAVKYKYKLWVTNAEQESIQKILSSCPGQTLPKK